MYISLGGGGWPIVWECNIIYSYISGAKGQFEKQHQSAGLQLSVRVKTCVVADRRMARNKHDSASITILENINQRICSDAAVVADWYIP